MFIFLRFWIRKEHISIHQRGVFTPLKIRVLGSLMKLITRFYAEYD